MASVTKWLGVCLAALFFVVASGCGGGEDPEDIDLSTFELQIGGLLVGVPFDTTITVTNSGGQGLTVYAPQVTNDSNISFAVTGGFPVLVGGGDVVDITVTFRLGRSALVRDTVIILSSAAADEIPVPIQLTTLSYEQVQTGWGQFEADNFAGALASFTSATSLDPSYGDAFLGRGWSELKDTSSASLSAALASLTTAQTLGVGADARAGMAFANLNLGNHTTAIADADAVGSPYTFSHDNTITHTDLLWIKARAYFLLGDYASAEAVLDVLAPGNGLDSASPTYITDMADLIESLRGSV